jgi:hypothetical protein
MSPLYTSIILIIFYAIIFYGGFILGRTYELRKRLNDEKEKLMRHVIKENNL